MTSVVRAGMCECLRELVAVRNRQEISEAAAAAFIEAHPHIKLSDNTSKPYYRRTECYVSHPWPSMAIPLSNLDELLVTNF